MSGVTEPLLEALCRVGETHEKLFSRIALNQLSTQTDVFFISGAKNGRQILPDGS